MILMLLCPLAMQAEEARDTTFTVNGKQIRVDESYGTTRVSVFSNDGNAMTKTQETEFVDGREISTVYVTSPFIPQSFGKNKNKVKSHYPFFYMGFNTLSGSVMGTGGNDGMHTRDSKSWEWGVTLASMTLKLSKTFPVAFTSSFSIGQVHHHFQGNYILSTADGKTFMRQEDGGNLKKSYISYNVVRMPFMIEVQGGNKSFDKLFAAVGASVELRWNDHSRYFVGKKKHTETSDINMNPFGLNLEMRVGYGCLVLYGRAAVTPLLKTGSAPKCYPVAFGLGLWI